MATWKQWLHGLIAAFIGSAAASVGAMLAAPDQFNLTSWKGARHILMASGVSGIVSAAAYLKQSPLPDTTMTTNTSIPVKGGVATQETTVTLKGEQP